MAGAGCSTWRHNKSRATGNFFFGSLFFYLINYTNEYLKVDYAYEQGQQERQMDSGNSFPQQAKVGVAVAHVFLTCSCSCV